MRRCQDRRVEITHIARTLIDAIKSAGPSGVLFSQLKRKDESRRPELSDLKESGDLENFAEHVLLGSLERYTEKDAAGNDVEDRRRFISLEKNKDGAVYSVPIELEFEPRIACYTGGWRKNPTEPWRTNNVL